MKSACAVITMCLSFAQARGVDGRFFKPDRTPTNPPESTMSRVSFAAACPTGRRLARAVALPTGQVIGAFADGAPPGVPVS